MKKIDETVRRETLYIAFVTVILSALMQAVFLCIGRWDYTVLLGNVWTAFFAVLDFLLLGITVQKAVDKKEEDARTMIKASQSLRMLMKVAIAAIGAALPFMNIWAVLIPLFFPRIAIMLRPLIKRKNGGEN